MTKQYKLVSIGFDFSELNDHGILADSIQCVSLMPAVHSILSKIVDLNQHVTALDIFSMDVLSTVKTYGSSAIYPVPAVNAFVQREFEAGNIIAAFGINADETDIYLVVESIVQAN